MKIASIPAALCIPAKNFMHCIMHGLTRFEVILWNIKSMPLAYAILPTRIALHNKNPIDNAVRLLDISFFNLYFLQWNNKHNVTTFIGYSLSQLMAGTQLNVHFLMSNKSFNKFSFFQQYIPLLFHPCNT